jgi:hypothetical protein
MTKMKSAADETQRLIERIKASFDVSEWGTPQDSIYALLQEAAAALEAAAARERELREELERDSIHAREMQVLLGKQRDEIERLREARLHQAALRQTPEGG